MIQNSHPNILCKLFYKHLGVLPSHCVKLTGAGSNRQYFRLSSGSLSAIGCYSDCPSEAHAFVKLTECFSHNGVAVPHCFEFINNGMYTLQEDLGNRDLLSYIIKGEGEDLCFETLRELAYMQTLPENEWKNCVAHPALGKRLVMWDLNYFKYEFLKPTGTPFDEDELENDFEKICQNLSNIPESRLGFMMRDCQSRNIMIKDNKPVFIDYQGGRKGPALYDAVSFTWQAKAAFPFRKRMEMLDFWSREFSSKRGVSVEELLLDLPDIVLFRNLQVLGAYGFRGLVEHKAHFLESINASLKNLNEILLNGWIDNYPELKRVAERLSENERFIKASSEGLNVQVLSFLYKKGYPDDFSGNGGGFMFDCRAMHNPGRYEEYKKLTGLDTPVINFLEERGEVQGFLDSAWQLTDKAIERYIQRGFSSLQIGFGCTGGQHRSVYCAQSTANHIMEKFPNVKVTLKHRELD